MDREPSREVAEILERIADVLLVVAGVGGGDYQTRLRSDLAEDHPMSLLYEGINQMMDSLASERARGEAYQRELEEKIATIEAQREAIKELSTPIIEVWVGVLCLPVVGVMDSSRSAQMMESLLGAIVEKKANCAIIDITGIQIMDTATADHFLRMARAVRLLGCQCMLTGINPSIALTMQTMGVDLSDVLTLRSLRDALRSYLSGGDDDLNERHRTRETRWRGDARRASRR